MKKSIYLIFSIVFFVGCQQKTQDKYPQDAQLAKQWHIHKNSNFYASYKINDFAHINPEYILSHYTGKGVSIAVIDAALDTKHDELKNRISSTFNIHTQDTNVSSKNFAINYHGTAVTGIIAARRDEYGITGIAPEATIHFIHLDLNNMVSDLDFINAFLKAEKIGAQIINCSWGTGNVSETVKSEIIRLSNKGIAIVFASGNGDINITNDESGIAEVFSIGASDEENLRASYSNYGEYLDILAPGGNQLGILTLAPSNNYFEPTAYTKFYGTSASAPIISASLALLKEAFPQLSMKEIMNYLIDNSDKVGNITYSEGHNSYYGYGKINLDKTYFAILQNTF